MESVLSRVCRRVWAQECATGVRGCVSLWLFDLLSAVFGPKAQETISYLVPSGHYYNFVDGIVDTRDLVYYVSATFVFLFLASRVLESRRWQG